MPVRVRDDKESKAASFDPTAGQPVNVIALAAEKKDLRNVEVAKGAQNVPAAQAGNGPGSAVPEDRSGPRNANTAGSGSNAGTRGQQSSQNDARVGATSNSAAGNAAPNAPSRPASSPSTEGAPSARAANPSAPPGDMVPVPPPVANSVPPARPSGTPPPMKIDHPANGNFDVVLMQ